MSLCTVYTVVQCGIGHNSKYLGLPVDTGCHTKSWWTQASHPHTFYTHPSTQVKSKMKTLKWEEKTTILVELSISAYQDLFPLHRAYNTVAGQLVGSHPSPWADSQGKVICDTVSRILDICDFCNIKDIGFIWSSWDIYRTFGYMGIW